jgi:hypothetical protein
MPETNSRRTSACSANPRPKTLPKAKFGTHIDDKGYLRISAGPLRGVRVHILVAKAMLGRDLLPDEIVHHKDNDKANPDPSNLEILNASHHNAITAKQYWFLRKLKETEEAAWKAYLEAAEEADAALVRFP